MSARYLPLHSCGAVCWIFVYSIRFEVRMGTENVRQKSLLGLCGGTIPSRLFAVHILHLEWVLGFSIRNFHRVPGWKGQRSSLSAQRSGKLYPENPIHMYTSLAHLISFFVTLTHCIFPVLVCLPFYRFAFMVQSLMEMVVM